MRYGRALLEQERPLDAVQSPREGADASGPGTRDDLRHAGGRLRADGRRGRRPRRARRPASRPTPTTPSLRAGPRPPAAGRRDAPSEALPCSRRPPRLSPRTVETQLDLGRALESARAARRGRGGVPPRDRARPELPRAHYALGRLLQREGKTEEAQRELSSPPRPLRARAGKPSRRYDVKNAEVALRLGRVAQGQRRRRAGPFEALPRDARTPCAAAPSRSLASSATPRPSRSSSGRRRWRPDDHRIELLLVTERASARGADDRSPARSPWPPRRRRRRLPDPAHGRRRQAGIRFIHDRGSTPEHHLPEIMGVGTGLARLRQRRLDGPLRRAGRPVSRQPGARRPPDRLYRNNGDGTFTDVTEKAGLSDSAYGMGAAAADYDNDGFVDLYVTNYGRRHPVPQQRRTARSPTSRRRPESPARAWARARHGATSTATDTSTSSSPSTPTTRKDKDLFCGDRDDGRARLLPAHPVRRHPQRPLPQQRQRDVHRRHPGGGPRQRPSARGSASSSWTSTSTASPTSTSPTTRS